MIKAILFDYDGTLSDRKRSAYKMYRDMMHQICPEISEDSVEMEALVQRCMLYDQNGIAKKNTVMEAMKPYIGDIDVQKWAKYWADNFDRFQTERNGVKEVLKRLHQKYRTGILSNGTYESQLAKIQSLQVDQLVDEVIVSGQYGIHKPDRRIFEIAAERLGASCEETVFVGDTFFTDIYGALNAGMKAVWIPEETGTVSDYTGCRISTLFELCDVLEKGGLQ